MIKPLLAGVTLETVKDEVRYNVICGSEINWGVRLDSGGTYVSSCVSL